MILKAAHDKAAAGQLLKFLKEPAGVALMEQYGFTLPSELAGAQRRPGAPN